MFEPILAMVVLYLVVFLVSFTTRIKSVRAGETPISYFDTFTEGTPSPAVLKTTRHYANMFEMPVLFFAVAILAIVLKYETSAMVTLAWVYVAFRTLHAFIHITSNSLQPRILAFLGGNICLFAMWAILALGRASFLA